MKNIDYKEYIKQKDRPIDQSYKLLKRETLADQAMMPIMKLLWSYKEDSIQETHHRHAKSFHKEISESKLLSIIWEDKTSIKSSLAHGLHHIPSIWGRKKYIVIENIDYDKESSWYIWRKTSTITQINKLPIRNYNSQSQLKENLIRLLIGPEWNKVQFFAINKQGDFLNIKEYDRWCLGDMKYPNIRLF